MVRELDTNQPVFNVRALDSFYRQGVLNPALLVLEAVSFSGLTGLALALIGLHGLVASSASRRTREIGIRMAIGASRPNVLLMVLRQGMTLTAAGVVGGLDVAIPRFAGRSRAVTSLGALNPASLAIAPPALALVAAAACLVPAGRAARIQPTAALRMD